MSIALERRTSGLGGPLDPAACHRALAARDRRFDGVFFVGVQTTGIYCRPVCTARTPGRSRCRFFRFSVEAESEGFRACLRCRPELAPGVGRSAAVSVDAVPALVAAAVRQVDAGRLNDSGLEDLAAALGVSSRHLRRSMQAELGVGPIELAQSRRLAMAKRLLQDSELPISDIAFASGFQSVRRFNHLFRERFGRPPTSIRKGGATRPVATFGLRLDYRPPLDWPALLHFLAPRAVPGVEHVDERTYARAVRVNDCQGWLRVRPMEGRSALWVDVSLSLLPHVVPVAARLRRLFDLDAQPDLIARHLKADPIIRPLVARRAGLRVPGAFDPFETAVRVVLGQQISVAGATTLAGRLAAQLGPAVETPTPELCRAMPAAIDIAQRRPADLSRLGILPSRALTLVRLAQWFVARRGSLEDCADPLELAEALGSIPGIGPWTVEVLAMRVLGWPDAFPGTDLGIRRALGGTPREIAGTAERWRPWRAYAAMHLWSQNPEERT